MSATTNVIPTLHYADAAAAIDWLEKAFGFTRQLVVEGPEGTIAHAELLLGRGMVMLGTAKPGPYGMRLPREAGGNTQGIYVPTGEIDAHCARAKAAGASIIREPFDTDYGSRDYSCLDLEGHLWHFGTYDPWATDGS